MRSESNGTKLFRILITLLGMLLILWGVMLSTLNVIGKNTEAVVTGFLNQRAEGIENISDERTCFVNFIFTLPDGKKISGRTEIKRDVQVKINSAIKVKYFDFSPKLNLTADDTLLKYGFVVFYLTGFLLIFLLRKEKFYNDKKI